MAGKTIASLHAGASHNCVIADDQKLYCWGGNWSGQLGNGSTTDSSVPVAVNMSGLLAGKTILSVSLGLSSTCVVASDNKAYCWGGNSNGELGNNSSSDSLIPVAVDASDVLNGKTITAIAMAEMSACALANDNTIACWGWNYNGQLGNDSQTQSLVPVAVDRSGALSGKTVQSIIAGSYHVCVVTTESKSICWGGNSSGELGIGTSTDSWIPVATDMSGVLAGKTILKLDAGNFHTCVIASDNHAYCWGNGPNGELGNNTTPYTQTLPVAVDTSGVLSGKTLMTISGGYGHSCTTTSDYTTFCWGEGLAGKLGNNATTNSSIPVAVYVASAAELGASQFVQAVANGVLSTDFRNASGALVATPTFSLTNAVASTTTQTTTGILGTDSQRLRVDNPGGADSGFSLTLVATTPGTGVWSSGTNTYPYNGATAAAGQLTINPSTATWTAYSGTTTALSKGAQATFSGSTPITLVTASATLEDIWGGYCTGIGISQTIPASTPTGTYTLSMTQTVTAL